MIANKTVLIYQQEHAIQGIEAAIHIVAEKKIVVEGRFSANFKQFQQIEKLSVHCPDPARRYRHRHGHRHRHRQTQARIRTHTRIRTQTDTDTDIDRHGYGLGHRQTRTRTRTRTQTKTRTQTQPDEDMTWHAHARHSVTLSACASMHHTYAFFAM